MAFVEAANPQGVPIYLESSSDGKTPSNPARMVHDVEPKACLSQPIGINAAGTSTLVNGATGSKIRVTAIILSADAACEVTFKSDTTTEAGPFYLAARSPLSIANIGGIFECATGDPLKVTVAAAGAINLGGVVSYRIVDA